MTDWTPSTEQVRSHYVFNQSDQWDPERGEAFDRWLAAHDAQVRAAALQEAAESYVYVHAVTRTHSRVYEWLRTRAARIAGDMEKGSTDDH